MHMLTIRADGGAQCSCGWEPELGKETLREFDKHLLEVEGD